MEDFEQDLVNLDRKNDRKINQINMKRPEKNYSDMNIPEKLMKSKPPSYFDQMEKNLMISIDSLKISLDNLIERIDPVINKHLDLDEIHIEKECIPVKPVSRLEEFISDADIKILNIRKNIETLITKISL